MQGTPALLNACDVRAFFFNFVLHDKNKFNYIAPPTDDILLNNMIGFFNVQDNIMTSTVDYSVLQ